MPSEDLSGESAEVKRFTLKKIGSTARSA